MPNDTGRVETLHRLRTSRGFLERAYRLLQPPALHWMNPAEPKYPPRGRWNLYVGGAGSRVDGYVNVDLFPMEGVNVAADVARLPFPDAVFEVVECDAVLEHVIQPDLAMQEIRRVTAPGGLIHVVTPFCHPFHAYPHDYRRFTIEGLKQMGAALEPIHEGWRTGPAATMLVFTLEFVKLWLPYRWWRAVVHVGFGWVLFPFRYLDAVLLRWPRSRQLGNHCYVWFRKPADQ